MPQEEQEKCAAQTHKMVFAITARAADGERKSRTTGFETTGLGSAETTGLGSAATTGLGKAGLESELNQTDTYLETRSIGKEGTETKKEQNIILTPLRLDVLDIVEPRGDDQGSSGAAPPHESMAILFQANISSCFPIVP
ncbi:hypothetical protein PO909_009966 [Leuciscus waleckii]